MPQTPQTPGELIQSELAARNWTHDDLARMVGRYRPEISMVIAGKRALSAELAVALSKALGHSPQYWLQLESARQLSLLPNDSEDVDRRVRMYTLAPITDMEKRGWIRPAATTDALEDELRRFFDVASLEDEPRLCAMPRKTDRLSPLSPEQRAWVFRAKQLAKALPVVPFDHDLIGRVAKRLRELAAYPEEARHVAKVLSEAGVRFVVVEPLRGGQIDGAAFWLDERSPVIAISLRIDRVDAFWFTLFHELAHIKNRDSESVDTELFAGEINAQVPGLSKEDMERRADDEAADMLIPTEVLQSFVRRVGPLYSKERLVQFAHRVKIHPAIIVGQLQYRGEIKYGAHREMMAKVRDRVISTAITDGWKKSVGTI